MRNAVAGLLAFALTIHSHAQSTNAMPARAVPGPAMWQVSNGENQLWIFPLLTPLGRNIAWQSEHVQSVIAQSQEYIYVKQPEIDIPANPFKLVNGLRLVYQLRYNPDGKTLEDVIPADLYARYSRLLAKYPLDDMENVRPYFAADGIRGWAILNNSLTEDHGIDIRIEALAAENGSIKVTPVPFVLDAIDYEFLKASSADLAGGASLAGEIHCLEASVASIEKDIPGIQARAKAWETGDMPALRDNRNYQQAVDICRKAFLNVIDESDGAIEAFYRSLLNAAERALRINSSTFAAVDIDHLIGPEGLLERLRAKGYSIVNLDAAPARAL